MERRIAPERPERDARVLVNVAFADLDEAAELREAREPHRDRLGGERVENDVHAAPVGEFHDGFGEVAAPRVDHMLHAERLEQRAFGCAARRGDDFGAEVMCDLDRRHADAARARVDEDTFASAEVRHVLERMPRSHEDHGQRRRFLERQFPGMRRTSPPRASVCVARPNTARPNTRSPGATCFTPAPTA